MSNNSSTASRVAAHNSKGVPYTGWIEGVGYQHLRNRPIVNCYFRDGGVSLPNFEPVIDTSPKMRVASVGGKYRVEQGENLPRIARRFGTTPDAIMAANPSIDWAVARKKGALIYPGELLEIPPVFEEASAQNRPVPRAQVVDLKSFYCEKGRGTNWMDLYQSDYSGFTLGSGLYNTTIDFAVKSSAAELRNSRYLVRGYNLSVEAAKLTKLSMRLNVAGGVVGALDNGVQAVNDFSNGRNRRGYVQATQATAYTLGTGLLFVPIPGARLLGGAIILGAGVSDLVEWVIETDW